MSIDQISYKLFQDLNEEEIYEVWRWRNHPEIRKWMVRNDPIPFQEHLRFIERLRNDRKKVYVKVSDYGVVNFHLIGDEKIEIGLHKNPRKFHVGTKLLEFALDFCKERYGDVKVVVKVMGKNEKAIKLYRRYGFLPKNETKPWIWMERTV